MIQLSQKLQHLLQQTKAYIQVCPESEFAFKLSPDKWSKKEILGHLIDSGINNLQRFTEIQFEFKPYRIRKYDQDALVKANQYATAETLELLTLWLALNERIKNIIESQDEHTLRYSIELSDGRISDLRFLMEDYVDHMEHHVRQMLAGAD